MTIHVRIVGIATWWRWWWPAVAVVVAPTRRRRVVVHRRATTRRTVAIVARVVVVPTWRWRATTVVITTRAVATRRSTTVVVVIHWRRTVAAAAVAGRAGAEALAWTRDLGLRLQFVSDRCLRRVSSSADTYVRDTADASLLERGVVKLLHSALQVCGGLVLDETRKESALQR